MKILITGGVGHIGTNLCNEAIKRGHNVVVMDNLHREEVISNLRWLREKYTKKQFQFVWGDVRNQDDFDRVPVAEAIIHAAANPGIPWSIKYPLYDFETNAKGTLHALEFARKCGNVPFIYASTNKTFSDVINEIPVTETDTRYKWGWTGLPGGWFEEKGELLNGGIDFHDNKFPIAINQNFPVSGFGKYGHSMYGISKLTGELYVQEYHVQYDLPAVINRMSCIYGLFQKGAIEQGWISHFINKIGFDDGELQFFGTGKQVRDVLDARDLAKLYLDEIEQIEKCDGEIFTVGGGPDNTVSLIEVVAEIEKQTGKKSTISYHDKRPADQDIYISSLTRVEEVMGWKPTISFKQTVADMIKEYSND